MPDLFLPSNLGEALVVGGVPYKRVSATPVQHVPQGTIGGGDTTNINTTSFAQADPQGDSSYPGERMAVALINDHGSYSVSPKSFLTVFNYNCPTAGVLRMWVGSVSGSTNARLYVNGVHQSTVVGQNFYSGAVANVNNGDLVQLYNNETYSSKTMYVRIWPFEYTGSP